MEITVFKFMMTREGQIGPVKTCGQQHSFQISAPTQAGS